MEFEFAPHVDEIKRALDNEIDEMKILADLKKLIEYCVPVVEAKRSLIKKYGGNEKSVVRKLKDIQIGEHNVEVTGKILAIEKKTINIKNLEKTIFSGSICDETASRSFTAWSDLGLNSGDVIHVTHAYVRNWQERPQLNIGERAKIIKLNTYIQISMDSEVRRLSELKDGDAFVHTMFNILSLESREINTKDGVKKIHTGIAADADTKIPLTLWVTDPELIEGNSFEVKNAYIRSYRGIPSLNINETSILTKLDRKIEYKESGSLKIEGIIGREGAFDVLIEGNILSIKPGSGLIARCPVCSRVIQKSTCRAHGKVDERLDMRIKAILDDGTGALMLVLDSILTEKICGYAKEEARTIAKAAMSHKAVEDKIKKKLLGKKIAARGNISTGEFGTTLVAKDVWEQNAPGRENGITLLKRLRMRYRPSGESPI